MYDKQTHTLTERPCVRLRSQGENCVNSSARKEQTNVLYEVVHLITSRARNVRNDVYFKHAIKEIGIQTNQRHDSVR